MPTLKPQETVLRKISKVLAPLWGIRAGLYITTQTLFRRKFTTQYPENVVQVDPTYRGKISLLFEPVSGEDLCISCKQCENICPVNCIHIIPRVDENKKRHVGTFDVDLSKCLFCGLCEEICPENCIVLDPIFDYTSYSRDGLYMTSKGISRSADNDEWTFITGIKEAKKREAEAGRKAREVEKAAKDAGSAEKTEKKEEV